MKRSSQWFRVYEDILDSPKVQKLPPHLFKTLINLWAICSRCEGTLPSIDELAYMLRRRGGDVRRDVAALRARRCLDDLERGTVPHDWDDLQFKSDLSTQRVRDHRKRFNGVSSNVSKPLPETAPEAEADTEAETDRKTERKKEAKQPLEKERAAACFSDFNQDEIERQLCQAADVEKIQNLDAILALIRDGASLENAILPAIRQVREAGRSGKSWKYYLEPIREYQNRTNGHRTHNGEVVEPVTFLPADDPRTPILANRHKIENGGKPPAMMLGQTGVEGRYWKTAWISDIPESVVKAKLEHKAKQTEAQRG